MNKLLMVMVLCASAVAASAQGLQPRRTLGGRLQRQKMLAKAVQQQETVDGFTWSYRVSNGEAIIMKLEKGHESCAVSPTPKGHFTIPSTLGGVKVTGIGGYAFVFCSEMTSVTLPDAVKEICGSAFLACGLTSVKIPEGVTGIGNQAFYGCGKLTSVTIPASVESIGWGVFGWCPQLKQINLADGNQRFTVVDGVLYTKDLSELIMCPNTLTSVKIPSKVSKIGMMSFEGCEGLVSLTIPEGVTNIDSSAFRGCRKLASVTIPASVESIGEGAFGGCKISVDPNNRKFTLVDGVLYTKDRTELVMCPISLTSVTILPDVKVVRPSSFSGCGGLTSITIPESVTNIGHSAFWGCNGLKSVTIPSRVASIGQQAFNDCRELTTVTILGERPASLNNIFDRCGKLKAIHVPAKCKSWAGMKKWQKLPLIFDGGKVDEKIESDKSTEGRGIVAGKLQSCDFLLNKDFKKNAKFYLCLFSASWCGPCRREMPRIAKTYAETLKDNPDIELIHFSRDQNDEKALAWAKEHDVKFPVVKPNGGNPLDLHSRGIPHLFIIKADGTLVEEGHPMRIFNEEKFKELKSK